MNEAMYIIEARKNTETVFEVFYNLELAVETLHNLIDEGYEATIMFP